METLLHLLATTNKAKLKVYISGKITGMDLDDAKKGFSNVETQLEVLGFEPVNPMNLVPYCPTLKWCDYMAKDIEALLDCDAIFLMENWKDSKGARCEYAIAKEFGLKVIEQKTNKKK